MATDNNDFTHEFQIYSTDLNAGTMGTGKFLLFDNNINAVKVENIDNIKIGGGSNGKVLATDGEGNLRWVSAAAGSGGVSNYNDLDNLPDLTLYVLNSSLATVATTGSYNDLTNKPSLFSGAYADLTNKPTLVTSYNQLTDKPTIPSVPATVSSFTNDAGYLTSVTNIAGNAATVTNGVYTSGNYSNPAWIASLAYSKLTGAPTLATVATSGSYTDLTGKPTLATVATSGSYSDLINRPTIFSGSYTDLTNKPALFDGAYLSLTGRPNLAAVATSGSYDDLTNKPSIPAAQVNADWNETISESPAYIFNKPSIPSLDGYATEAWVNSQGFGSGGSGVTSYNDLTDKPFIPTSFSDLGITAGADGQILTLNSSLVPVWTTPTTSTPTMISSGNTAPGSAVVANETNVSVNFSDGGSGKYVFNTDELSVGASIVPQVDNAVDLGSPTNRFRHLYVAPGTIYLGNIKLTNLNGKLDAKKVVNPGEDNEYDDETDSDAFSPIRGSSGVTALENLEDVSIDNPNAGQVLTWNGQSEKWENQNLPGGGSGNYGEADVLSLLGEFAKGEAVYGFDSNGILAFPNNFRVGSNGGNGEVSTNNTLSLYGNNGIELSTAGNDYHWYFNDSGDLILPSGGDIKDSNGNSVLGGSGTSGFTLARVAGQDDVLASESGNVLELIAGEGIALITNTNDGTITVSAASNASPHYGYFAELKHTGDNNRVNGEAVAMDSDGNSYVSYSYYDDNASKNIGGVMKFSSTGAKLWNSDIASQNGNADYVQIVSLEYSTINSNPALIAFGKYYDNNTSKDVGVMYYINPSDGSVGASLLDAEITSANGIRLNDGIVGSDGEGGVYAVVVGETYSEVLQKTFTPLAGSTVDKLYISWADFNASGVLPGEQLVYNQGSYYGAKMNGADVSANPAGSTDPTWYGLSLTISTTESGSYVITRVNGWGGAINGWSNPVTLTVPGSSLGGVDGVNDMIFDFDNSVFNNDSNNITAAVSNIQGTPISSVYCSGFNGHDWSTDIGNTITLNYELGNQAYIARFGDVNWSKSLGQTNYDRIHSVVVDSSNNVYAAGYVSNGNRGSYVVKYNVAGAQQWSVFVDSNNNMNNELYSIDLLADGNVITVDEDGVVTKLNSEDGSIIWQISVDSGPSWDGNFRGTATPDGNYICTNYEDNDYTMYVMCISGTDGSSVWTKRITRVYGGSNGEIRPEYDFNAQYIDCNDTYVTIAANTELNNNTTGLVFSFPLDGQNVDGTYGQYAISSESLEHNTESTGSVNASSITEFTESASVNSTSPTANASDITVTKTNIGGGTETPTAVAGIERHSASTGDNNVTLAAEHNGKFLYYNGSNGNSWIYVPSNSDVALPIGFTVTVVMDYFEGNRIYVNNNTGSQNATINASGFNYNETNYWQFGATASKCGIYTIMKVDTDRWMLAGPDVTPD